MIPLRQPWPPGTVAAGLRPAGVSRETRRARRARRRARRPARFGRDAGRSRPPKPKRVNSYSELSFSSIVRVDSLGTMALPAVGNGSASEDENSKRRPARAPSFGIDVDEEEEVDSSERGRTRPPTRRRRRSSRRSGRGPCPRLPFRNRGARRRASSRRRRARRRLHLHGRPSAQRAVVGLGEEEVVREESEWTRRSPNRGRRRPPSASRLHKRARRRRCDRTARPAVAAFATAGAVGRAALPHGPPGLRRRHGPRRLPPGGRRPGSRR